MQMRNFSCKFLSWKYCSALVIVSMLLLGSNGFVSHADESNPSTSRNSRGNQPPPNVARDIAEIQRRLGGSIVEGGQILSQPKRGATGMQIWDHPLRHPHPVFMHTPVKSTTELKVDLIRNAAAQLDAIASQLEFADLYSQADDMRDMAKDFRNEARDLRRK